ncbi:MAG: FAD/NAD(P)-binding protein [Firmicutes bacterium]|nr:FAD/NAD(P)-binding protein [Bacillota bacterium]
MTVEILQPALGTVIDVRNETTSGDVKRIVVEVPRSRTSGAAWAGPHRPGQCAMLSVFGVGECMISVSSSPPLVSGPGRPGATVERLEFAIKNAGRVTSAFHELEPGSPVGVRGPYGNGFPVDSWKGMSLLFAGGGIGMAPLRSVINYCLDRRDDYGPIRIVYGARSPGDLCFKDELFEKWPGVKGVQVDVTVDSGDETWPGPVGFVPQFTESLAPSPDGCVAVTCGPPVMIRVMLATLERIGFKPENVFTTLELKMQCGVGKCGRCNTGSKYVCVDGPVFTLAEMKTLPSEY